MRTSEQNTPQQKRIAWDCGGNIARGKRTVTWYRSASITSKRPQSSWYHHAKVTQETWWDPSESTGIVERGRQILDYTVLSLYSIKLFSLHETVSPVTAVPKSKAIIYRWKSKWTKRDHKEGFYVGDLFQRKMFRTLINESWRVE
jgi:hypothetical protein